MSHPPKTYDIINLSTFSTRHLEVREHNCPILWIERETAFLSGPTINIHANSANGPVIASTKSKSLSSGFRVYVNGIEHDVRSESLRGKQYGFWFGGQKFLWKRTHNPSLGASSWGSSDFKLVDAGNPEQILASYIKEKALFSDGGGGMQFFVELGQELEVMAMAAIFGIVERIRRINAAASGGSGGGGGA